MTDAPEFNQKISEESKTAAAFERFLNVIKCLRAKDGCPWDIKQTPLSMRTDLAEETFEAIDAISQEDVSHAKEELGDVLLNTLLISYMYEQNHDFTIEDAINEVAQKIIRRHPHVFHASEGSVCADGNVKNAQEVLVQWDKIKETVEGRGGSKSILDEVPKGFPPLLKAYKMQKKAAKKGFDWNELPPVKAKILEELAEVEQAGSCCLHVDAAGAPELLHGFHLRAGDVHVVAAVHHAFGQKQVRVGGDIGVGNLPLVQRAQQLLGANYSSISVGKSFMHKSILPFNRPVRSPPLWRLHSKHSHHTTSKIICQLKKR